MNTVIDRVVAATTPARGVTFITAQGTDSELAERITWAELHADAQRVARALVARGIGPGRHVAILSPTSRDLVTTVQAIWLTGATVVILPLPMRLASIDAFVESTVTRIIKADTALVIADPNLAVFLPESSGAPVVGFADLVPSGSEPWTPPQVSPDALAILQFTSGSTAEPKGVMLPHHVVGANLDAIVDATGLQIEHDVLVSWLPLYHDMGLIGFLTLPMLTGVELVLATPQDFLAQPARWMQWIHDFGGTVTAGPNFAYALAARGLQRGPRLDLSRLRVALNGAEPVDRATVDDFVAAGVRHQVQPAAMFPAFGMAELTIAGTFPEVGSGARFDVVDRDAIEHLREARPTTDPDGKPFAVLGRPVPGLELRIVDPRTGIELDERRVGELQIRGTSVTTGYYENANATAALFTDKWLHTGDLGYTVNHGELVLCGRIKDVIIVGGRNVFPEDVEHAAASVEGVRTGNVVAFSTPGRRGKEALVVVAETRAPDPASLHDAVVEAVCDSVGIPPHDVVFVAAGTLPKTSSGKLQRSLCRQQYIDATAAKDH